MVHQGYGAGLRMWGNSVVPLVYHRDPFFRFLFRIYFLVVANISAQRAIFCENGGRAHPWLATAQWPPPPCHGTKDGPGDAPGRTIARGPPAIPELPVLLSYFWPKICSFSCEIWPKSLLFRINSTRGMWISQLEPRKRALISP